MASEVIGRNDEIKQLRAFLDAEAIDGPRALVLEGEAGIGKSTLWLAGVESARDRGVRILFSRPAEVERGLTFAGLGDLLEGIVDEVLRALSPPRRRALEVALLMEEASEPADPRALGVAVRNALEILAAEAPLVVAIDDVQWLDPSSARALSFALRRVQGRLLVLLARRIDEEEPLELAAGLASVRRLRVGPLSAGAIQQLLRDRLGRVFPRRTLLRIHETAGGNPFYALELARALGPDVDPTRPLPVPETLEGLLGSRLAGLPAATGDALAYLAAAGSASLRQLATAGVAERALEPARAGGVVVDVDGGLRFAHPLLASVAYQALRPSKRRRVHELLALVVDDPLDRARHLALATDEPDVQTAAVLEEAATIAGLRGASSLSAHLSEHAFRRTPPEAVADAHRRALAAAHAHLAAGDVERARRLVVELESREPDASARADVLILRSELEPGNLQQRITARRQALRDPALTPEQRLTIHQKLALMLRFTEALSSAQEHARAAVAVAEELEDDGALAISLAALALLRFTAGEQDTLELAERAYGLSRAVPLGQPVVDAGLCLAHVLTWSADLQRARALLEELVAEWSERDERVVAQALWYLSLVELRSGRLDVAGEHANRSRELSLLYGRDESENPQNLFAPALVAAHRGELEHARVLIEAARPLAEQQRALLPGLDATLGLVELWSGHPGVAIERFDAAERAANAAGWADPGHCFWRGDYVEALLSDSRADDAVRVVDEWEAAGTRLRCGWVLAEALRGRGLVAAARGDVDDAAGLLEAAAAKHDEVGDRFNRARSLLAFGVVLRRARRKRAAREAIAQAVPLLEECGATAWAEKASAELGRIGGRRREEGLTPAERRVAALVAAGKTNREVAAALVLGERTVETHLTHIYAKLGVRSRTELARTFTSRD